MNNGIPRFNQPKDWIEDTTAECIKQLLDAGYQFDFETWKALKEIIRGTLKKAKKEKDGES